MSCARAARRSPRRRRYSVANVWEPRLLTDGTLDSDRDPRGYTSLERHAQDLEQPIWLELDLGAVDDDRRAAALPAHRHADPRAPHRELPRGLHGAHANRRRVERGAPRRGPGGAAAATARRRACRCCARSFRLDGRIRSARLYAVGLGVSEARLNGRKVGDAVLEPANTDFRKRVLYSTYDVTGQVRRGANTLGFMLGDGIYNVAGELGPVHEVHRLDGPAEAARPARGHLRGRLARRGRHRRLVAHRRAGRRRSRTGTAARTSTPAASPAGWDAPGADHDAWRPVEDLGAPADAPVLSAQAAPPVRVQETVRRAHAHRGRARGLALRPRPQPRRLARDHPARRGRPDGAADAGREAQQRPRNAGRDRRARVLPVHAGRRRRRDVAPALHVPRVPLRRGQRRRRAAGARRRPREGAARRQRARRVDPDLGPDAQRDLRHGPPGGREQHALRPHRLPAPREARLARGVPPALRHGRGELRRRRRTTASSCATSPTPSSPTAWCRTSRPSTRCSAAASATMPTGAAP